MYSGWDDIESTVIRLMTRIQSRRVEREYRNCQKERRGYFKDAFFEFIASQPLDAMLPGLVDTALRPQIQHLVDAPVEEDIAVSTFENVLKASFPQIAAEWRRSVDEHLLDIMKRYVPDATTSDLSRPTTIFRCDICRPTRNIYYPLILVHPCALPLCRPSEGEVEAIRSDLKSVGYRLGNLRFDQAARDRCIKLLQGCGIDPNVITLEELQEPSFILECKQCPKAMAEKPRTLMTWDQAVRCLICLVVWPRNWKHSSGQPQVGFTSGIEDMQSQSYGRGYGTGNGGARACYGARYGLVEIPVFSLLGLCPVSTKFPLVRFATSFQGTVCILMNPASSFTHITYLN